MRLTHPDYPADHPRYLNSEKYHEAGYDSFVTSKVFLRLATRLNAPPTATVTDKMIASTPTPPVQASTPTAIVEDEDVIEPITTRKKKKKAIVGDTSTPSASASRFSTANIYSMLEDDNRESPVATPVVTKPDSPPAITVMSPLPVTPVDNTKISGLMPGWNSEFWHTYGNKLRVFGTIEEVCDLTRKPRAKPVVEAAEEGREQEEGQEDEDDEGGVELERRSSLLSMLQSGMQSLWPAKK
jgi:poly(A)-specific ribonuclease